VCDPALQVSASQPQLPSDSLCLIWNGPTASSQKDICLFCRWGASGLVL